MSALSLRRVDSSDGTQSVRLGRGVENKKMWREALSEQSFPPLGDGLGMDFAGDGFE